MSSGAWRDLVRCEANNKLIQNRLKLVNNSRCQESDNIESLEDCKITVPELKHKLEMVKQEKVYIEVNRGNVRVCFEYMEFIPGSERFLARAAGHQPGHDELTGGGDHGAAGRVARQGRREC